MAHVACRSHDYNHHPPHSAVRVFVIAEVRMYRDGLAAALAADGRLDVVGTAGSVLTMQALAPDVIVVDPGDAPVETLRLIAREQPASQILAVAVRDDAADVVARPGGRVGVRPARSARGVGGRGRRRRGAGTSCAPRGSLARSCAA